MRGLILGAGKMTSAILEGLSGIEDMSDWMIYSPSGHSAKALAAKVGALSINSLDQVKDLDFILLGCKPQQLKELKKIIGDRFASNLFLSLLAAISERDQLEILGARKLIRIMPNLPVKYRVGVSLVSSESVDDSVLRIFLDVFQKLGKALFVKEAELEELTILTGSGPALFYEFTKNLAESFESLNKETREDLARQVFLGSAISCQKNSDHLNQLIDAVTSKGGVTIATLESWRTQQLSKLLKTGISQGQKRAQELRDLLAQN